MFVITLFLSLFPSFFKSTYREPIEREPQEMGYPARSIYEPQHRMRHSPWGNSRVVLSRQYFRGMEIRWLSLVDLWKTYALPALLINLWSQFVSLAGSGKSVFWFVVA